jgi:hypothetical protein
MGVALLLRRTGISFRLADGNAPLVGISFSACYIPAHRAMGVDPMVALHYE